MNKESVNWNQVRIDAAINVMNAILSSSIMVFIFQFVFKKQIAVSYADKLVEELKNKENNMYKPNYGEPNLGKNVQIVGGANFGSEPYLITIGDNTTVSFDCAFVTHDAATRVIRNLPDGNKETVIYAPINIGKNCFIGCRTVVLPGVTIGDNCIIGAGSIVNRDIPSNTVAAGSPCKPICSLYEYREKHKDDFMYIVSKPFEEKKKILLEKFSKD